jgi:hypothetical protein
MNHDRNDKDVSMHDLEETMIRAYRNQGYSYEEAERRASAFCGLPPKGMRAPDVRNEDGIEWTAYQMFRNRGCSTTEAAINARRWISG